MNVRLKTGEKVLWGESADANVRAKSQGMTLMDRIYRHVFVTVWVIMTLYYGYESIRDQDYIRLLIVIVFLAGIIWLILIARRLIPNPFTKHNVGEQFDHYVITNQRLRLFRKNINKGSDFPIMSIDHAFIMYPKAENFLTISFKDDPDEDKMLSLDGVEDFSNAVEIINKLVGHPR